MKRALLFSIVIWCTAVCCYCQIDWKTFMSGQDMIWNRLPQTWYEAPFMGNGSMGTYICKEPEKNAIRVDVNNSMVHDHREDDKGIYGRSRLLIGYFLLHPVGEITSGTMRLDLWDAETRGCIRTTSGEIKLRACVTLRKPLHYCRSGSDGRRERFYLAVLSGKHRFAQTAERHTEKKQEPLQERLYIQPRITTVRT